MDVRGELLIGGASFPGSTEPRHGIDAATGERPAPGFPGAGPRD